MPHTPACRKMPTIKRKPKLIAEEFSQSDWDALEIGEREP